MAVYEKMVPSRRHAKGTKKQRHQQTHPKGNHIPIKSKLNHGSIRWVAEWNQATHCMLQKMVPGKSTQKREKAAAPTNRSPSNSENSVTFQGITCGTVQTVMKSTVPGPLVELEALCALKVGLYHCMPVPGEQE